MKEIPVKTTLIKYEAFDGTRFDTKEECFAYEGSQFGLLMQQLEKSIIKKTDTLGINKSNWFEPFNTYYVIVPKTRHDIFVLGQILEATSAADKEQITGDDCDQPIILCVNLFCNVVADVHIIRMNDLVKDLTNCQFEVISNMGDTIKDNKEEIKIAEK